MPDPMTTATSRPVPRNSASSRRHSRCREGCWVSGMGGHAQLVEQAPDAALDVVAHGTRGGQVEAVGVLDGPGEVVVAGEHRAGVAAAHGDGDVGIGHDDLPWSFW